MLEVCRPQNNTKDLTHIYKSGNEQSELTIKYIEKTNCVKRFYWLVTSVTQRGEGSNTKPEIQNFLS